MLCQLYLNKISVGRHTMHTIWYYLCKVQKQAELIYNIKSQGGGYFYVGDRRQWQGWGTRVHRVTAMLYSLTLVRFTLWYFIELYSYDLCTFLYTSHFKVCLFFFFKEKEHGFCLTITLDKMWRHSRIDSKIFPTLSLCKVSKNKIKFQ